jgi:hypothetical protein
VLKYKKRKAVWSYNISILEKRESYLNDSLFFNVYILQKGFYNQPSYNILNAELLISMPNKFLYYPQSLVYQ